MPKQRLTEILKKDYKNYREFQHAKRQEFKEMIKWYKEFRIGCAYTPAYPKEIEQLEKAIESVKEKLKVKNWE